MTAVIGSANASARSRDALLEAAVVSGDESAPAWTYTHAADRFVLPSPSSTEQSIGSRAHHEHTGIHNGQENDSDPERRPRSEP